VIFTSQEINLFKGINERLTKEMSTISKSMSVIVVDKPYGKTFN
jgi:hypothetical protein